jgi:fatty acid elongase 3
MGKCAGEEFAAIAGICIITSYLFLFLAFYATYKKPVPKGRRRATSALVEMKDEKVPTVGEARRRLSTSRVGAPGANGVTTGASPNGRATRSRKA